MTAEEEVRAAWVNAHYDGHRIIADHYLSGAHWILSGNINYPFDRSNHQNEQTAWKAALEYTRSRLAEIAELDEEMSLLAYLASRCSAEKPAQAANRIHSRLQSIRADLTRGMNPAQFTSK